MEKRRFSVTLTDAYVEGMDQLVEMGIYLDHQAMTRDVLRQLMKEYHISPFYLESEISRNEIEISRYEILQAVKEDKAKQLLFPYIEEKLQEAGLELTEDAKSAFVNAIFLIMKKVNQTIKET